MTKKRTQPAARRSPGAGANYSQLTEHINAILADEATPVEIYNPLSEAVLELCEGRRANLFHPDVLRVALPIALDRAAGIETAAESAPAPAEAAQPTPPAYVHCANLIADLLEAVIRPKGGEA